MALAARILCARVDGSLRSYSAHIVRGGMRTAAGEVAAETTGTIRDTGKRHTRGTGASAHRSMIAGCTASVVEVLNADD